MSTVNSNEVSIKDLVKNKKVFFMFYRTNELWYKTEDGFEFPVPLADCGEAMFKAEDKAMYLMKWIRKHMKFIEDARWIHSSNDKHLEVLEIS